MEQVRKNYDSMTFNELAEHPVAGRVLDEVASQYETNSSGRPSANLLGNDVLYAVRKQTLEILKERKL